jgi:hypothetical protein
VADLGEEVGIDTLTVPDATDGLAIVEDEKFGPRSETEICGGGNEAIPACPPG